MVAEARASRRALSEMDALSRQPSRALLRFPRGESNAGDHGKTARGYAPKWRGADGLYRGARQTGKHEPLEPRDLTGTYSGGKFVVSRAGEAYDV